MTDLLFQDDAYLTQAPAKVVAHTPEGGIVLDRTVFYPNGGGQPGDSGALDWAGTNLNIATTVKADAGGVALVPAELVALPPIGTEVEQHLDWGRRHRHMRMHTALHLLSVVIPLPVTGGQVGANKGRLDFAMSDPPEDCETLENLLNRLVDDDLPVTDDWITLEELDANPGLVKTMSVAPPRVSGRIRLVRIGLDRDQVDLQPCGGTHVARTGEIGLLRLGKFENKGKQNRRVYLHLDS